MNFQTQNEIYHKNLRFHPVIFTLKRQFSAEIDNFEIFRSSVRPITAAGDIKP